jgi:peroxiredoxin Q/BCP
MTAKLVEGAPAPAFDLPRDGGGMVSLASLKGKKVVLYFYPKDDTPGCTTEAIDFTAMKAKFKAAGAEVIGVSPDSVASHEKFCKKHELDIILLADESKEMLEAYDVWKEKSMYGKTYMGVERTTVLIDGAGKIARIWPKVKVAGHAEEVLKAAQDIK